jgi:hypothetical protein
MTSGVIEWNVSGNQAVRNEAEYLTPPFDTFRIKREHSHKCVVGAGCIVDGVILIRLLWNVDGRLSVGVIVLKPSVDAHELLGAPCSKSAFSRELRAAPALRVLDGALAGPRNRSRSLAAVGRQTNNKGASTTLYPPRSPTACRPRSRIASNLLNRQRAGSVDL